MTDTIPSEIPAGSLIDTLRNDGGDYWSTQTVEKEWKVSRDFGDYLQYVDTKLWMAGSRMIRDVGENGCAMVIRYEYVWLPDEDPRAFEAKSSVRGLCITFVPIKKECRDIPEVKDNGDSGN